MSKNDFNFLYFVLDFKYIRIFFNTPSGKTTGPSPDEQSFAFGRRSSTARAYARGVQWRRRNVKVGHAGVRNGAKIYFYYCRGGVGGSLRRGELRRDGRICPRYGLRIVAYLRGAIVPNQFVYVFAIYLLKQNYKILVIPLKLFFILGFSRSL